MYNPSLNEEFSYASLSSIICYATVFYDLIKEKIDEIRIRRNIREIININPAPRIEIQNLNFNGQFQIPNFQLNTEIINQIAKQEQFERKNQQFLKNLNLGNINFDNAEEFSEKTNKKSNPGDGTNGFTVLL